MKKGTITTKEILDILQESFGIKRCLLESFLKVGGEPQLTIFKRLALCKEKDKLYSQGNSSKRVIEILTKKYGFSRVYIYKIPQRYKENIFEFNCCK